MSDTAPERVGRSMVLLTGCRRKAAQVFLTGWWTIADTSSRLFEWKAVVRRGGMVPLDGVGVAALGCSERGPGSYPYPGGGLLIAPDGFADVALVPGNVFIPLDGEASLDHDLRATVTLEAASGDAADPPVTVSIAPEGGLRESHGDLHAGDSFAWGDRRAAIVRIVEPQGGKFGAIGWVEIRLAGGG